MANPTPVSSRKVTRADFNALGAAVAALEATPPGTVVGDATGVLGFDSDGTRLDVPFVTPEMFGAVGDNTTNDGPAFAAAIAWLAANSEAYSDSFYRGSHRLVIAAKKYYLGTTTLDLTHTLVIEGQGTGQDGGIPTYLRWAAGTTGIRVQRYNTSGASTVDDPATHRGGDGSIIRGLFLQGAYSGTEGEYHGIHLRARALIEDCYVYQFAGDGVHIGASFPNGNANLFILNRVTATGNRDGVSVGVSGSADVNAGNGFAINAIGNRRWGINDASFLGNNWYGCHAADNGLVSGSTPTIVSNGTYRYVVKDGQAAAASTNAPSGTASDNAYWLYNGEGAASPSNNIPLWTSGITVRAGGCYRTLDAGNASRFDGCYSEGGQGLAQFTGNTLATGGLLSSTGVRIYAANGNLHTRAPLVVDNQGGGYGVTTGDGINAKGELFLDGGLLNSRIRLKYNGTLFGSVYFASSGFTVESYDTVGGYQPVAASCSNFSFVHNGVTTVVDMDSTGIKLASGKVLKVNGTQVVGAQGAAVADVTGGSTVDTECRAQLNALLARMRAHGLIA